MATIYDTEYNRSLMLYARGRQILMRHKSGEMFGRPILLANDHDSCMTDARCNGTIYYAYLNVQGRLVLRSISDQHILYQPKESGHTSYIRPQIAVFCGQLLLFYITQNQTDQSYSVKCAAPFRRDLQPAMTDTYPDCPTLGLLPTDRFLFICVCTDAQTTLFQMDEHFQICSILPPSDSGKICEKETELPALKQQPNKKINEQEQQQKIPKARQAQQQKIAELEKTRKDQQLKIAELEETHKLELSKAEQVHQSKLAETEQACQLKIDETEKICQMKFSEARQRHEAELKSMQEQHERQVQRLNAMIESATRQYNELMSVAQKYREEALKWAGKFQGKEMS